MLYGISNDIFLMAMQIVECVYDSALLILLEKKNLKSLFLSLSLSLYPSLKTKKLSKASKFWLKGQMERELGTARLLARR